MAVSADRIRVPSIVGFFNPVARRVLKVGALLGPNALITIRGRKSGLDRTTPVALVEIGGQRWVIGTFGEVNWVRNLRAAGRATLSVGRRRDEVLATELDEATATAFFRHVIAPYTRRMPLGIAAVLLSLLRADELVKDPAAATRHRPVFGLRQS